MESDVGSMQWFHTYWSFEKLLSMETVLPCTEMTVLSLVRFSTSSAVNAKTSPNVSAPACLPSPILVWPFIYIEVGVNDGKPCSHFHLQWIVAGHTWTTTQKVEWAPETKRATTQPPAILGAKLTDVDASRHSLTTLMIYETQRNS